MRIAKWTLGAAGLLVACAPKIDSDPTPTLSASPVALFAPPSDPANPCDYVLPFPTDLAKNAAGGLDISYCPNDDEQTLDLKTGLRTLGGFSINSVVTAQFSRPLDPDTLAGAVLLLNGTTGAPVDVTVAFKANDDTPDPADDNTLYIVPSAPLAEDTQYIAIVTTGVHGANGLPVISDQVFTFAKSETPIVDPRGVSVLASVPDNAQANSLEGLRVGMKPLFDMLATVDVGGTMLTRDKIALTWTFTTQIVHASLPLLAAVATETAPSVTQDNAVPAADQPLLQAMNLGGGLDCVYTGRITLTNLVTATNTFGVGADGLPVTERTDVDYVLTTPKTGGVVTCDGANPWNGTNVAIFVHGLGRCKNDALALADSLGATGWATLSLDGPHAGARLVTSHGDQDLDGCADQGATPEIIAPDGVNPNPFALRDNMREWGLELVQAAAAAKSDAWAFAGLTKPAGATTKVAMIGHSWGGMAAVLAGSVSTDLSAVITNATSGEFGAMFAPLLQGGVALQLAAAGVDVTTAAGQATLTAQTEQAVETYRWILEPADPLYAATAWPDATPKLAQVVAAGAGTVADAPLHATATQTALATALSQPLDRVVFDMTVSGVSACDSSTTMVGALLQPCAAAALTDPTLPAFVKLAEMRSQVMTFLLSDGALVCTPGVDCP